MKVRIVNFHYGFFVNGGEGGLNSLEAHFAPAHKVPDEQEVAKSAMQDVVDRHVEVLDRLFAAGVMTGGRTPIMNDFPSRFEVGYQYKGAWIDKKPRVSVPDLDLAALLSATFGVREPDMRGGHSPYGSLSASVTFSATKSGEEMHDPEVVVKFSFDHKVNVCLFSFTRSLHGVEPWDRAAESMAALERTLALDWDMTGRDHYRALAGVGSIHPPG